MEIDLRPKLFLIFLIFLVVPAVSGCTSGFLYTNVTFPLTTDMTRTPVGSTVASVSSKLLQEPFTGLDLSVEWDSRALGDAARKADFETIYFADIHTISILGGLWERKAVLVWGQ